MRNSTAMLCVAFFTLCATGARAEFDPSTARPTTTAEPAPVAKGRPETSILQCSTPNSVDEVNACAAQRSANWTMASVIVSILGFIGVGAGLVVARNQIKEDKENAVKEFRAYMHINMTRVEAKENGCLVIHLKFDNYGRTPARNISATCQVSISGEETKKAHFSISAVHPNYPLERDEVSEGGYSQATLEAIGMSQKKISFRVDLVYMDEFKRKREDTFLFKGDDVRWDGMKHFFLPVPQG